jgi:hypothetical protein
MSYRFIAIVNLQLLLFFQMLDFKDIKETGGANLNKHLLVERCSCCPYQTRTVGSRSTHNEVGSLGGIADDYKLDSGDPLVLELYFISSASTKHCDVATAVGNCLAIVENHSITVEFDDVTIMEIGLYLHLVPKSQSKVGLQS